MNMNTEPRAESASPPLPVNGSAPVFEHAPVAVVEVQGRDHTVSFVNRAFCRLLHKTRAELIGKMFAEIVCNGDKCMPLLDRIYQTGEAELHVEADASEPGTWLYAMWPELDVDQRPEKVIVQLTKSIHSPETAVMLNEALLIGGLRQHELREEAEKSNARLQVEITEHRRTEAALQEAQAQLLAHAGSLERTVAARTAELRGSIGELEAFSYTLAHDLRAPIRAIHGFTELALEMSSEQIDPPTVDLLDRVIKAAGRMDSLIQDVLSLSQVIRRPISLSSLDVDALVRALVKERPELSLPLAAITIESPLLPMLGHEASLSQCLTNLLGNAVKFVELGVVPRIRVWTQELPVPETGDKASSAGLRSAQPAPGSIVRLWVEDQGIGIAAEAHEAIFEIFQRLHPSAKYEGTGIGLAIVRKAVERMGGRAGVEAEPGKGSRFWLELAKG